jgi:hypothetical protein
MTITTVSDPDRYAAEVMDADRDYPLVLLTSRLGEPYPALDPAEVENIVGADTHLGFMETSFRTKRLDELLPTKLGVFGGAARIWWPGVTPASDPYDHPLIHDPYATYGEKTLRILRSRWVEGPPAGKGDVEPELVVVKRDLERAREQLERSRATNAELQAEVASLTERAKRAEEAANEQRRLRRAAVAPSSEEPAGTDRDPEAAFHVLIASAWADALTSQDRRAMPFRPYRLGAAFLEGIDVVPGAGAARVAWVCAMVACDRAREIDGLDLHQLRSGHGGSDPQRTRRDGAVAWRCAVKRNQPAAPRLHYWVAPDGVIEFADVVAHDEMRITA